MSLLMERKGAGGNLLFDKAFCFESYGVPIRIEADSADVLAEAERTAVSALLGRVRPIECDETEHVFRFSTGADGDCHLHQDGLEMVHDKADWKLFKFFDSLVRILVAEHAKSVVFVHAGVVGWRGRAIVIPANSFYGKTTLVAELVKRGADYYSDEYAVLDEIGLVYPFERRLSLRSSVRGSIVEASVSAEELGGSVGAKPLPLGCVLLTKYEKAAEWRPEMVSPGRAVVEMIPFTIPIRANTEFVLNVLKIAVGNAIIAKSLRGDAEDFSELFLEFVDKTMI